MRGTNRPHSRPSGTPTSDTLTIFPAAFTSFDIFLAPNLDFDNLRVQIICSHPSEYGHQWHPWSWHPWSPGCRHWRPEGVAKRAVFPGFSRISVWRWASNERKKIVLKDKSRWGGECTQPSFVEVGPCTHNSLHTTVCQISVLTMRYSNTIPHSRRKLLRKKCAEIDLLCNKHKINI